jgi:hypothetical protein
MHTMLLDRGGQSNGIHALAQGKPAVLHSTLFMLTCPAAASDAFFRA